ncbi:MAG: porin [Candidatus Omnitrophota bacterium]
MKKIVICLACAGLFCCFIAREAASDEVAELREQLTALRKQMDLQAQQMEEIQRKIADMERVPQTKPGGRRVDDDFRVYWKKGLLFKSDDDSTAIKLGGRIQADFAWMGEGKTVKERLGTLEWPAEIRRLRLYIDATVYENYVYKLQVDFAGGEVAFRDVYIGMKNVPYLGLVRIGQFTEPFSLEDMSSSNDITFLERSLPYALSIHRNTGIAFNSTFLDERVTFSAAAFYNADDLARPTSNAVNAAVRMTGLPYYEEDGAYLAHLGAAYSLRNPTEDGGNFSYSSSPEVNLAPNFVDTGDFAGRYTNLVGLESLLIHGPFSVQGEFIQSFVSRKGYSSAGYFEGLYVYASYILTGEHRKYNRAMANVSGVTPRENFSIKKWTPGALEIAARYSYLDFNSTDVKGGVLSDITIGFNWYLNPNMKIMTNYVHAHPNGIGDADIIAVRCQANF